MIATGTLERYEELIEAGNGRTSSLDRLSVLVVPL
jgi:hypothetical protein